MAPETELDAVSMFTAVDRKQFAAKLVELVGLVESITKRISKLCAKTMATDQWLTASLQSDQGLAMIEAARGR